MRLIDADELLGTVKDIPTWWADEGGYFPSSMQYPQGMFDPDDIVAAIENALTVNAFVCPVKPGQTVWEVDFGYIFKDGKDRWSYVVKSQFVTNVCFADSRDGYEWCLLSYDDYIICWQDDWMKTTFPTREEAEEAAKRMEEERK